MEKAAILANYMPEQAAPVIAKWIDYFQCEFKISKGRTSKLGDYRHPFRQTGHQISVNNNLNPYAFLVTTVHEFAHLLTWNEHQHHVKPHGTEWKSNYKKMMAPFLERHIFPGDLEKAIGTYLSNPSASSCTNLNLSRALKKYDNHTVHIRLEDLDVHTIFYIKDGRRFKKGHQLRKRYRCECLDNGNIYLFSPLAEVFTAGTGT